MVNVSAVLVNYNAGDELRRALQSLSDELRERRWEALVVDNASTDGSQEIVGEFYYARLLQNRENVGFARAMNQALAATTGSLVVILNPDCRLVAGAIATLKAELERHEGCAIVGPRILNPDGTVQGSARGDPDMLTGLFGRTALMRRLLPWMPSARRNVVSDMAIASGQPSVVVDWLSGACMLAPRDALRQVGGFDERFFPVWFEDVDFCLRAAKAGYRNWYEPSAAAIHEGGHSVTRVTLPERQKYWYGSLLRFATKHFGPYSAGCILASSAIGLALRGIASSFSARRRPERQAYFQAIRMILTGSIANSPSPQSEKGKKQTFIA